MSNMQEKLGFDLSNLLMGSGFRNFIDENGNAEIVLEPQYTSGNTPVGSTMGGITIIAFELANIGAFALSDFQLLVKPHERADWHVYLTGAAWGTIQGVLKHKVGTLNTLAVGAKGFAYVDIGPVYSFKLQGKGSGTNILTNGTFTTNADDWVLGTGIEFNTDKITATAATATFSQPKANMASAGALWVADQIFEVNLTITDADGEAFWVGTNANPFQHRFQSVGPVQTAIVSDGHADGLIFTLDNVSADFDNISLIPCAYGKVRGYGYR